MTYSSQVPVTSDPRTKSRGKDITPVQILKLSEEEGLYSSNINELTESLENLVNQTGQLRTEIHGRPIKYNVQIFDIGDENYKLAEPILAIVEEYPNDDTIIASFPEVETFGEGVSESEAIINLKFAILDLYEELLGIDTKDLGNLPKAWLQVLKRVIQNNE